jgi:hypothetical protein
MVVQLHQYCPDEYQAIEKNNETHSGVLSIAHATNITIQC